MLERVVMLFRAAKVLCARERMEGLLAAAEGFWLKDDRSEGATSDGRDVFRSEGAVSLSVETFMGVGCSGTSILSFGAEDTTDWCERERLEV